MGVWNAIFIAIALLLILLAWMWTEAWSKHARSGWEMPAQEAGQAMESCPVETISQIFSATDSKFISAFESPALKDLFLRERTAVALHWVQDTSAFISRSMRRHVEASRLTADLEIATETRIFLQYARLRLYCGLLFMLIGLLGPQRLAGTTLHAGLFYQRIVKGLTEFQSAVLLHEQSSAESV